MFERTTIAAATVAIAIMGAGVAFAQQTTPAPARADSAMPMMGMMEQMSKMMENCNRMMQSNLGQPESGPGQQQPTQQPPQGNRG